MASIAFLKRFQHSLPMYKPNTSASHNDDSVRAWSVDTVCAWVGEQIFSRYRRSLYYINMYISWIYI